MKFKSLTILLLAFSFSQVSMSKDSEAKTTSVKIYEGNQPKDPFSFSNETRGDKERAKRYLEQLGFGNAAKRMEKESNQSDGID